MNDVELLWAMLGSQRGWHQWEWLGQPHELWSHVSQRGPFRSIVAEHAYTGDLTVGAVPTQNPLEPLWHAHGSVLWCRCETGDQVQRLERFHVKPTLVLREGGSLRRVALWALRKPLSVPDIEKANKRLAYHLRCVQKHGGAGYRLPVPGTVLRTKNGKPRGRPVPVVVGGGSREVYGAGAVVKRLKDPPEMRPFWEIKAELAARS